MSNKLRVVVSLFILSEQSQGVNVSDIEMNPSLNTYYNIDLWFKSEIALNAILALKEYSKDTYFIVSTSNYT